VTALRRLPPRPRRAPGFTPGFTLVETVMVLILLGILAVAALSTMGGEDRTLPQEFSVLKTHIRFAQAQAMGLNTPYGIRWQDGAYWLFTGADADTPVRLPGQDADTVTLHCALNPAAFTLAFNGRGQTFTSAALGDANALGANRAVTLSLDGQSMSFTVTAHTGYIP
jgi:prepilin-type N-terminal cleavage/methylation domain-containing protein